MGFRHTCNLQPYSVLPAQLPDQFKTCNRSPAHGIHKRRSAPLLKTRLSNPRQFSSYQGAMHRQGRPYEFTGWGKGRRPEFLMPRSILSAFKFDFYFNTIAITTDT